MRTIRRTSRFKKDYKREARGQHGAALDAYLAQVVTLLASDEALPERLHDHPLSGGWQDHRDCHIRPDLVLIYRLPDAETVELVRLGTHSEWSL